MSQEIDELFETRPIAEIIEILPQDRDDLINEAERLILDFASTSFNGGNLTDLYRAMVRSFLESFARKVAIERSGRCSIIDINVYERALLNFKDLILEYSFNLGSLRDSWLNRAKTYISDVFEHINKVFEPYLIGELCEKLYLNNKGAIAVLEELKNENFIQIVGKQYGHNLFVKI